MVFSERNEKEETTRWIEKEETMLIFATEKLISL